LVLALSIPVHTDTLSGVTSPLPLTKVCDQPAGLGALHNTLSLEYFQSFTHFTGLHSEPPSDSFGTGELSLVIQLPGIEKQLDHTPAYASWDEGKLLVIEDLNP
jgi:hypothetical protein